MRKEGSVSFRDGACPPWTVCVEPPWHLTSVALDTRVVTPSPFVAISAHLWCVLPGRDSYTHTLCMYGVRALYGLLSVNASACLFTCFRPSVAQQKNNKNKNGKTLFFPGTRWRWRRWCAYATRPNWREPEIKRSTSGRKTVGASIRYDIARTLITRPLFIFHHRQRVSRDLPFGTGQARYLKKSDIARDVSWYAADPIFQTPASFFFFLFFSVHTYL